MTAVLIIVGLYLFGALIVIPLYTRWEDRTYGRYQAAPAVAGREKQHPKTLRSPRTPSMRPAFLTRPLRLGMRLTRA
jgi:hypothetical protein